MFVDRRNRRSRQGRGGKRHQRHEVRISQGLRRRKKLIFRRTRCARLRARSRIGTADGLCARRPACGSRVRTKAPGRVPAGRARRASGGFGTRSRVPSCRRSRARRRTARPNAEKLRHVQRFRTDGQRVEQSVGPHVFCFRGVGGAARPRILHRTQMLSGVPKLGAQRPTRCILPLTPTTFAAKQTPRIRRFKPVSAFLKRTLFQHSFLLLMTGIDAPVCRRHPNRPPRSKDSEAPPSPGPGGFQVPSGIPTDFHAPTFSTASGHASPSLFSHASNILSPAFTPQPLRPSKIS